MTETNADIADQLDTMHYLREHMRPMDRDVLPEAARRLRDTMGTEDSEDIELERDQLRAQLANVRHLLVPLLELLWPDAPGKTSQARIDALAHGLAERDVLIDRLRTEIMDFDGRRE